MKNQQNTSPPRRPRISSLRIQPALLAAAIELLEERGLSAFTIQEVATRANVAPMGIYNHFGDKQGLLDAIIKEGFSRLRENILNITDPEPISRLRQAGIVFRNAALDFPETFRLMFTSPHRGEQEADKAFQAFVEVVRYGQTSGAIIAGDTNVLANTIWACVQGGIIIDINRDKDAKDDMHKVQYDSLLDLIIRGVQPLT